MSEDILMQIVIFPVRPSRENRGFHITSKVIGPSAVYEKGTDCFRDPLRILRI